MMLSVRIFLSVVSLGTMVLGAGGVSGQPYPNKLVRIVTASAGGNADFFARLIGQEIAGPLGQPVVIENRAGIIAAETVMKAPPDGYTLLVHGPAFWIGPLLQKLAYDPVKDYAPIALVASAPNILVVHPSLPVKSVKELVALAKARPKEINYASNENGSSNHLAAELFNLLARVSIVRVPYKGTAGALTATIGGEVQVTFTNATTVMPHAKSGRLRALAVTSAAPSPLVPGLPTVAATVPGYESVLMTGIFAPAKTPTAIINRLNQEIVKGLRAEHVKERVLNSGAELIGSSPEALAAAVKTDMSRMGKVIEDAGIRAE